MEIVVIFVKESGPGRKSLIGWTHGLHMGSLNLTFVVSDARRLERPPEHRDAIRSSPECLPNSQWISGKPEQKPVYKATAYGRQALNVYFLMSLMKAWVNK